MDDSRAYKNVKFTKTDSTSPSGVAHERELKMKIGNRPNPLICLLCLVTSALIVIVVRLSIHGMHSNLHHQFTEMETKYRSVNETKAQICELLTSRRVSEPTCPQNWIKTEDRCYFISKIAKSYDGAREHCSELDSRLLEINSNKDKNFASNAVNESVHYWIGKCANWNLTSVHLYELNYESLTCRKCKSTHSYSCKYGRRYICERSAHLYADTAEEIRGVCQQPVGPISIK